MIFQAKTYKKYLQLKSQEITNYDFVEHILNDYITITENRMSKLSREIEELKQELNQRKYQHQIQVNLVASNRIYEKSIQHTELREQYEEMKNYKARILEIIATEEE